MEPKDVRWHQRFNNYNKALSQLSRFINKGQLNEFEEQGLIKSFEYTYELAWNTIKDFYEGQGETGRFFHLFLRLRKLLFTAHVQKEISEPDLILI